MKVLIDTDVALGSSSGDIDDAFALVRLFLSDIDVVAVTTVFGNTSAPDAERNARALLELCGVNVPVLRGADGCGAKRNAASSYIASAEIDVILSLGPLSNLALAFVENPELVKNLQYVILVGGWQGTFGRWPPWYPFEFNLTKDPASAAAVLESGVPIKVVPLNQARKLRLSFADLAAMPDTLRDYFQIHSRRWFRRSACLKLSRSIPLWDLVAAELLLEPEGLDMERVSARFHKNGFLDFSGGDISLEVLSDYDPLLLKRRFFSVDRGIASETTLGECA